MREVYIFDRKGIENFIKSKEDTTEYKRVFEKCGLFSKDDYIIYSDEYDNGSPLENLRKFLESKFGEYAFEDFYAISHKKKILKKDFLKLKEKRNSKFLDNLFEFYNIKTTNKKGIWIKDNNKLVKYKIEKGDII